jgi:hypothetical protein
MARAEWLYREAVNLSTSFNMMMRHVVVLLRHKLAVRQRSKLRMIALLRLLFLGLRLALQWAQQWGAAMVQRQVQQAGF